MSETKMRVDATSEQDGAGRLRKAEELWIIGCGCCLWSAF